MEQIEIEVSFLLSSLPNIAYDEILRINQHYKPELPVRRVRKTSTFLNIRGKDFRYHLLTNDTNLVEYERTTKTPIETGGCLEQNISIVEKQYNELKGEHYYNIDKIRHVRYFHQDGHDLKWEIDDFSCHDVKNIKIIKAELEIPSVDFNIEIPTWLKPYVLMNVTDNKAFSNFNLAKMFYEQKKIKK